MSVRLLFLAILLPVSLLAAQWNPLPQGESHVIASIALGEWREIVVVAPPRTAGDTTRLPLVVLLDGDGLLPLAAALERHHGLAAGARRAILVGVRSITPTDRVRIFTPPPDSATAARYPVAGGGPSFSRFLREELIPFVVERYPVGVERILVGHSLAGLFVVTEFAEAGSSFTGFVAISPTLGWQSRAVHPRVAAALAEGLPPRRLHLSTADEGPRYPPEPTRELHALVMRAGRTGTEVTLHHFAGVDHVGTVPPALARWFGAR